MKEKILPGTSERVPNHTRRQWNESIRLTTEKNLHDVGRETNTINQRLQKLEREWDIERILETNASALSLLGIILGVTVNKKWFFLPGVVSIFLLQHALQGWCPPVPLLRQRGVRTQREIDEERFTLKALRGDFAKINPKSSNLRSILDSIRT